MADPVTIERSRERRQLAVTAALRRHGEPLPAPERVEDFGEFFARFGDARIVLGACSNIQDNSLLLTDSVRGDLVIGERVTFGHNVRMSSGEIGDDALVGMMAIVGEHVVVERGGCIAAGAWVEPGTVVRAGWIWAGRPARAFREVKPQEREIFARGVDVYVGYGRAYLAAAG